MGIFSSDKHLFDYLEEVVVDRNFLNLHKYIKNFEFDQRSKTGLYSDQKGEHLGYDFFIQKRRVRFCCTKRIIKNYEMYEKYYDSEKVTKTNKGYIGIPELYDMQNSKSLFPLGILELYSIALIKEKHQGKIRERFINTSNNYFLWIDYKENRQWEDDLVKDFDIIALKLIKETIKNLKRIKDIK